MNPFKIATTSYHDYEIMKDLQEHCTRCELKSSQAKTWQTWRDAYGIQFAETSLKSGRYDIRKNCANCNKKTVHRQLATIERNLNTSARSGISAKLAIKIKFLLKYEEAFLLKRLTGNVLEIDHKFPQIRWNVNEENNENTTDEILISKFILLTRSNNLLKSRNCERCVKTNKRGNFPGIYFWYEGDENWKAESYDEKGCIGCFWYDPYKWREKLNKIIKNSQNI
jgi:ICEA Protein